MKRKWVVGFAEGIQAGHLGCFLKRLVHPRTVASSNVATSIAILEPGQEIRVHSHEFEEAYFVVEGRARMRVENDEFDVGPWDSVYVPGGAEHWTLNTGSERLVLLCSLSPPPEFSDER